MESQTVQQWTMDGAGFISHFNLTSSEHKLPYLYTLTEEEEKRMYDIQGRLRLAYDSHDVCRLLYDILLNIPFEGLYRVLV
jgi:hypothetical protein